MSDSSSSTPTGDRLKTVASELFAERGYAGTSLAEIAKRLGIRKPSLYNYYGSKDELFMDLLTASVEAWRDASRPALDGPGSHHERLHRHLHSAIGFAVDSPHAMAMCRVAVSQVGSSLSERVEELLLSHRQEYRQRLEAFFIDAVQAREVRPLEISTLVLAWQTFLDGVITRYLFAFGHQSLLLEQLDDLWRLFWRGIAAEIS